MNIREFMNNNPAVVTIGAVVILVICLGAILFQLRPNTGARGPVDVFYFDLNTNQLFSASAASQFPPIQSPTDTGSALSGVRAMVFSCTDCKKKDTHFIGYLERYTLEAKQKLEEQANMQEPMYEDMYGLDNQREVKRVEDTTWTNAQSPEAEQMMSGMFSQCEPGARPRQCFPR